MYSSKNEPQNETEFFNKFGKYENKKSKLKNELHQEYNDFLNQVRFLTWIK